MHIHKKGIRTLGISESFRKGISKHSILAGVVMRADLIVDGFTFSRVEVGGMDATQKIIEMFEAFKPEEKKRVPYCEYCNNGEDFTVKGKTTICRKCGRFASKWNEGDVEALQEAIELGFLKPSYPYKCQL